MDETMNPLYILGWPLGYVMEWIYKLIPNYGWDIILFTLLITVIKIPLQLNQQKSMARMSAFQPMVAEIQKKYRDKPEKQQEELMKLQEQGYKPTAGCMPMLVNFLVMFGVIEVVYRPLQRIFHIGTAALTAAGEALTAMGISFTTVTRDTNIIAQVIAGESTVSSCFTPDQVATITEFGQHMDFFGIEPGCREPAPADPPGPGDRDHVPVHPHQHEGQRPGNAGQHEADHVYDAADVRLLLLHRAQRFLSVLRCFQHSDDRAEPVDEEDLRP